VLRFPCGGAFFVVRRPNLCVSSCRAVSPGIATIRPRYSPRYSPACRWNDVWEQGGRANRCERRAHSWHAYRCIPGAACEQETRRSSLQGTAAQSKLLKDCWRLRWRLRWPDGRPRAVARDARCCRRRRRFGACRCSSLSRPHPAQAGGALVVVRSSHHRSERAHDERPGLGGVPYSAAAMRSQCTLRCRAGVRTPTMVRHRGWPDHSDNP